MEQIKSYIRENVNGVYTICEHRNWISVYTHNVFVDTDQLIEWKEKTGAKQIEITYLADKADGLVYVFHF